MPRSVTRDSCLSLSEQDHTPGRSHDTVPTLGYDVGDSSDEEENVDYSGDQGTIDSRGKSIAGEIGVHGFNRVAGCEHATASPGPLSSFRMPKYIQLSVTKCFNNGTEVKLSGLAFVIPDSINNLHPESCSITVTGEQGGGLSDELAVAEVEQADVDAVLNLRRDIIGE